MTFRALETIQHYRDYAESVLIRHGCPTDYEGVLELSKTPDLERYIHHAIRMIVSAHMAEKYIRENHYERAISHTATLAEKSIELWFAEHHPEIGGAGTLPDMVSRMNKKDADKKSGGGGRNKRGHEGALKRLIRRIIDITGGQSFESIRHSLNNTDIFQDAGQARDDQIDFELQEDDSESEKIFYKLNGADKVISYSRLKSTISEILSNSVP